MIIAAALERIITQSGNSSAVQFDDGGKIVHIYFTGNPQTQCLGEMNFHSEAISNYLTTLNMFHLRSLEQGVDIVAMGQQEITKKLDRKRKHEDSNADSGTIKSGRMQEVCNENIVDCKNGIKEEQLIPEAVKEEKIQLYDNELDEEKEPMQIPYRQKMREESTISYNMIFLL